MKKIFTLLCAAVVLPFGMFAATTSYRSIAVKHADHHVSVITIETGMTTTATDGNLELNSEKGVISIPLNDVRNWAFSTEAGSSDLWAAIGTVAPDMTIEMQLTANAIVVSNLPAGSTVSLTAINGVTVAQLHGVEGECELSTDSLVKGIYILSVNNHSFKVAINR